MTAKITVYEKPTCTTCRNLAALFRENGIDHDKVNYFIEPFTEEKLRQLIKKTGLRPFDILRKGEASVKESGLTAETSDAEVLKAMVRDPSIIQRPIVEVGDQAVLARPIEKALELLNRNSK
jgi:arsenate reductase